MIHEQSGKRHAINLNIAYYTHEVEDLKSKRMSLLSLCCCHEDSMKIQHGLAGSTRTALGGTGFKDLNQSKFY